jgi:hypothetical protein
VVELAVYVKGTIAFPVPLVAPGKLIHEALEETFQEQVEGAVMVRLAVPPAAESSEADSDKLAHGTS